MMFMFLATCKALLLLTTPASASDAHEIADVHQSRLSKVAAATEKVDHPVAPVFHDDRADRIVVYSATWCGPCRRLKPVLASLKQEGYSVEHIDVDGDVDKLKYEHRSVPTIYYLRGETVVKKEIGYRSKEQITRMLVARHHGVSADKP